ncbi:hypothetical protein [Bosea sp. (in: a-proteobacteria)]|uniref:hypothetical protein n=1 Tax=Bosea sp. (in: a-proteobacteria) TaxID=1871050 RepID=UPI0027340DC9|nr:hypothetical protein [Bosea sp. (in: a-proteobacteria)]MDP3408119.1 hypothetical protein [Bosea sp. (in: a-proteobacteria)]
MAAKTSVLITVEHTAALDAFINESAGRTKSPPASVLIDAAADAEERLEDAGVAKTHRVGCEYHFRQAGPWANAYKYSKAVWAFRLRRKKDGWVIVTARGENVYPKTPKIDEVVLTEAARDAVVRHALAPFGILPTKEAIAA